MKAQNELKAAIEGCEVFKRALLNVIKQRDRATATIVRLRAALKAAPGRQRYNKGMPHV